MSALSDYLENELLDHVLRNSSYTSPSAVYAALFTTATADAGTGTEVSNSNAYARTALTFGSAASGGSISNTADTDFTTATGSWGTVTHMAIVDSATYGGGNFLFHGALDASKAVGDGDTFTLPSGNVTCTLA